VINESLKAFTEEVALPDKAINVDELPWVPQGERVWFKPLRFDLTSGRWINLLKVQGSGKVNRHRHTGGWRAPERSSTSRRATSTPWW
jgi:2,4'-dihydroxyacetophenone dioxygenase